MKKSYFYIRAAAACIASILILSAFFGKFYPIKILDIQFTALLQRIIVDFSLFAGFFLIGLLLITLLFGRIYCSTLCPLGLFQELLMILFRRKTTVQKNYPYKYFLAALVFGLLLGGTAVLVRFTDPYTLFGSAITGTVWPGIIILLLIAVLAFLKGRFFCSNICPVGVVLGIISKHAVNKIYIEKDKCVSCGLCAKKCPVGSIDFKNKNVDNETCVKCLKCLGGCKRSGIHYGRPVAKKIPFSPNRRKILTAGAALAVLAIAAESGIKFGKNIAAKVKKIILPAGAGNSTDFANRCLNCNLCIQNCPMKILKKANTTYSTVHIDYNDNGFCDYDCNKCSSVCPSGAIKRLTLKEKQNTQIALAEIDKDICVKCGLCAMKCPRQAITKENGEFPLINTDMCIGCGACKAACPVKAITITAIEKQRQL